MKKKETNKDGEKSDGERERKTLIERDKDTDKKREREL